MRWCAGIAGLGGIGLDSLRMAGLDLGSLEDPEMPSHVVLVGLAGFAADGPWMACVGLRTARLQADLGLGKLVG